MSEPSLDRIPVEKIAEEFAERVRRGEHPSITEYIERYPDLADDIRDLFPMLAVVEQFKPEVHESAATADHSGPFSTGHPQQLGDYRILRYLGEGGMGVVYEAVRESLSNHVALKVMHPQFRNREKYLRLFRTEARSAARLHHTNIVSVFDYGVHDGTYYYAMQYIAGQSLDKILEDVRRLRDDKKPFSPAATATMAWASREISALVPKVFGDAGLGDDSLSRAVTMGFLTGVYPSGACLPGSESMADATPTPTPTPTPALARSIAGGEAANAASPLSQLVDFPLRRIGRIGTGRIGTGGTPSGRGPAGLSANERADRCDDDRSAYVEQVGNPSYGEAINHQSARDDDEISNSSTSTLSGKTEDRYHREVARLGAQVADGLAYAHKRGVFHRDIKPSNLILDPMGNIWITDFGLAKFEDGEDVSQSRDAAGTLRYMAPERLKGHSDGRCDIYALGATLYEMLTLRPAFEAPNQIELIHRIEKDSPVRPRQLDGRISRDLETIILKALAKDPSDRFASAGEMARELRRYLENRPIKSRPIPFYQQFWRWCQRNPWLAGANIAAAVLTTALAIVSTGAAWTLRNDLIKIEASEAAERRAKTEVRHELFKALGDRARAGRLSGQPGRRFHSSDAIEQAAAVGRELKLPAKSFEPLRDEAIACMALPDLKPVGRVIAQPPGSGSFSFDSTMTRYALGFRNGIISVRQFADDQEIARLQAQADRGYSFFGLSPDGRYLATTNVPGYSLTVWEIERQAVVVDDPAPVFRWDPAATFSPDSRQIAVCREGGELVLYELATGRPSRRFRLPGPRVSAFNPEGTRIAVVCSDAKQTSCQIFDVGTGEIVRSIALLARAVTGIAWSSDSSTLAIPCDDRNVYLWDAATGIRKGILEGSTNVGIRVAFHPAGTLLASNGFEGRLRLWDPVLARRWLNLTGHGVEFSRDGRIVVTADDRFTTYQVDPALEYRTFAHASSEPLDYHEPSIRHEGRVLAWATSKGVVLWDLARGAELAFLPLGLTWNSLFEASGDLLTNGAIGVWRWPIRLDLDRNQFHVGPPRQLPLQPGATIGEDRLGRVIAVANYGFASVATPGRTIPIGPLHDCRGVAVSPDGKWLATRSGSAGATQIWRAADTTRVKDLAIEGAIRVSFSPDGKWLMAGAGRILEVGTWREVTQIRGGEWFSPDGRLVVAESTNRVLELVETGTGRTVARLESPDLCKVRDVAFSPDGSYLVVTTLDGPAVHVWDLRAIRRNLAKMGLDWDAPAYSEFDSVAENAQVVPLGVKVDLGPIKPEVQSLLEQVGALEREGKIGEAIAVLRQGARSFPEEAEIHNSLAWLLATGPKPSRNPVEAVEHARRAVQLEPGDQLPLNTLGVALYRAGKFAEAVETLEKSQSAGAGELAAFDLFFLAMAHHKLGRAQQARAFFTQANASFESNRASFPPGYIQELTKFRAEAQRVLAGDGAELPAQVFAGEL